MPSERKLSESTRAKISKRATFFLALVFCTILPTGCGSRYGTVPVRGKVSFKGGPMPAAGVVYFTPIETYGGHPLRPASADFDRDGNYEAMSFAKADGLFPGKYEAHVHCWEVPPTMDGPPPRSYLPAKYGKPNTSGFTLTVEEGSSAKEFNIDIEGSG